LENAVLPCRAGGLLYIAIYNDQGRASRIWTSIKRLYNTAPKPAKLLLVLGIYAYFVLKHAVARAMRWQNPFSAHRSGRGMSWFRDVVDWVGSYTFGVARADQISDFYAERGLDLL